MIRRDLGVLWAGDVLRKIESKLPPPREKKGAAPSLCQNDREGGEQSTQCLPRFWRTLS